MLQVCPAYCVVLVRTSTDDSHSLHTVFKARSLVDRHSHLSCVIGMVLVTRRFQTAPLPILPFTAVLNMATKEQPDVTSRQSNSFALACNWLIDYRKQQGDCNVSMHDAIEFYYCDVTMF